MAPGFNKRKRDHQGGHDFRPRLSPAEQRDIRIRKGIAEIGEPSRIGRDVILRSLSEDLRETSSESYLGVLAITRAVVYEQPHKIGYLSFLFIDANEKKAGPEPFELTYLVLEMVHDELSRALNAGDYDRFKVFLRFLCALAPIIENKDELVRTIDTLMERVTTSAFPTPLKTQLYKAALLAAVYLPKGLVGPELQAKLVDVEFPESAGEGAYDFFFGEGVPFNTQNVGSLLVQAAQKLKENGWNVDFLARNPLDQADLLEKPAVDSTSAEESGAPKPPTSEAVASDAAAPKLTQDSETTETGPAENNTAENGTTESGTAESGNAETGNAETGTAPSDQATTEPSVQPSTEASDQAIAQGSEPAVVASPVTATKHRIREIHFPSEWPAPCHRLQSDAFCRIYLPTNGVETVPDPANMMGLLLRDVAVDIIRHIDFNRREVTRQLIALDMFFNQRIFAPPGVPLDTVLQYSEGEPTWKIEDMALEAVYSQMFDLSADSDPFPLVYYHTLLVEACVMAPQDIAPVLGRALRFLFSHFATADAELLFRAVDWFAHHVSNFAFTWKWNEWIDTLQLPEFHPQQVFVRELLAKQVRLSYPQRVRDVLPEEFQPLVPDTPDMPPFKFAQDEKVLRFVDALQNPAEQSPDTLLEEFEPEKRADVLITCICDLGNRSLTHASNWIAKTMDLVRKYVHEERSIVDSVFTYWQQSQWIGALIVSQFVKSQLVSPQTFVDFVVSHADLLISSVGWEAIRDNVDEARKALEGVSIDEEWGEWWSTRLRKALDRKPTHKSVEKQADTSMEIDPAAQTQSDIKEKQAQQNEPTEPMLKEQQEAPTGDAALNEDAQDETDYEPRLNENVTEDEAHPEVMVQTDAEAEPKADTRADEKTIQ